MKKNKLIKLIILFTISLITLSLSVFAWFSITIETKVGNIISNVVNAKASLTFELKKNDGEYIEIKTINDMENFLGNIIPNDEINFKIRIENKGNANLDTKVVIRNIVATNNNNDFDMFDVYFIKDGLINLFINKETNYDFTNPPDDINSLTTISDDQVIVHEQTPYEQTLNQYRLSNILDNNNNLLLLDNYNLEPNNNITLMYTLKYDQNTSHPNYEGSSLLINAIYVYLY